MAKRLVVGLAALFLGACMGEVPIETRIARADPAFLVVASGETVPVGTLADDAADDPALWRNPSDPSASLIVGTDKKAGLYVYGLDGKTRSFTDAGRVNNVDLRGDVPVNGIASILVAASDRNDLGNAKIALFTLDPSSGRLTPLAAVPAGAGEAYGLCLYRAPEALYAFLVVRDGTIRQFRLDTDTKAPTATLVRTLKLASQSEGCAVDEERGRLYVGEENRGLWRFDARVGGPVQGILIAAADGKRLVADVEGVAISGGHLLVSSQGDNAYAVWRLADEHYLGRFRVAAEAFGATEETDGIELVVGNFGPEFPEGLLVVQDGINRPFAQNFKLVSWAEIAKRLDNKGL